MSELAGHTIHRNHIHHGWNNAFQPCLRIAPGETVQFETIDASSGQLTKASTATDLEKLDLGRVNPVTGPVWIDGAKPGDALKVTILELRPSGWGWTGNIPGFGLLTDQFPHARLHHWHYDPALDAGDVRAGRPRTAQAVHRNDRRRAGRAGTAQHHSAAQRRRQHGCPRHLRRYRALPAGRSRRRAVLGRRHARGAGRRRGLRHRDREPDRRRAQVRAREGRASALAALRDARSRHRPFRQARLRGHDRHRPGPHGRCAHGRLRNGRAAEQALWLRAGRRVHALQASAPTCASARSSTCRTGSSRTTFRASSSSSSWQATPGPGVESGLSPSGTRQTGPTGIR